MLNDGIVVWKISLVSSEMIYIGFFGRFVFGFFGLICVNWVFESCRNRIF